MQNTEREVVAIYCRLSEEDRDKVNETDDSESIQNQKNMLTAYSMEHGWDIYGIYSDDDYTGSDRNRPEFNRLLRDAESGKFNIVLCKTQARFTREIEMVEKYIHYYFPLWGVRFIGVVDSADTNIRGNKKSRQINGLVNEWYLEDMSENIRSVLKMKKKRGEHTGGFALYGYKKDPEKKGHLLIDEEAAKVVREIFQMYAAGIGKRKIAETLNARGIPNPTRYKQLQGLNFNQAKGNDCIFWNSGPIDKMLKNEMYLGTMVQGKHENISYKIKKMRDVPEERWIRVENTHEPIIDRVLWDKVQRLLGERTITDQNGECLPFSGKIRCIYCGSPITCSCNRGVKYYRCRNKASKLNPCIGVFAAAKYIDDSVMEELKKTLNEYVNADEIRSRVLLRERTDKNTEREKENLKRLESAVSTKEKCLKDLYEDRAKELVDNDTFSSLTNLFSGEKTKLLKQIDDTRKKIDEMEKKRNEDTFNSDAFEKYMDITKITREMVVQMIDYIEVGRKETKKTPPPMIIHWLF